MKRVTIAYFFERKRANKCVRMLDKQKSLNACSTEKLKEKVSAIGTSNYCKR